MTPGRATLKKMNEVLNKYGIVYDIISVWEWSLYFFHDYKIYYVKDEKKY